MVSGGRCTRYCGCFLRQVFDIAPAGVRKCIVSTNIAETSITIDGVRFIADSGKVKEMRFDPQSKMQRLQEFWISQASAEQRKGRAGRTGPGVCFRLYSEDDYGAFDEYSTPEVRRVPLDSLVLQMADFGLRDATRFPFLEAPPKSSIENAVYFLKLQGALQDSGELTSIGRMLAKLPVDVSVGTLLIMGTLFHLVEPVLIIAAALSVQSPLTRRIGNEFQVDVEERRRQLESEHGDAFFLLNLYDEWTSIKADRQRSSRKWCKRRGLEEQRFYEMSKLKRQFEELLRDHNLIRRRKRSRARDKTEGAERERLLKMKRDYRHVPRKRKVLRLEEGIGNAEHDEDDDEMNRNEGDEERSIDIHDVEFKLTHDLNELQKSHNRHREFTTKDVNMLKLILCSGLYPQVALPDETNPHRKQSEQVYHARDKQFLMLHPTSVYSMRPALLEGEDHSQGDDQVEGRAVQSSGYLMAYVSLLETNKPYLVNVIKVQALATLLLFARSLDTNSDCAKVVCDEWLELTFKEGEEGQQILSKVVKLRSAWASMLDMKLSLDDQADGKDVPSMAYDSNDHLRDELSRKLAAFLQAEVKYTLRRVATSEKDHIYVTSAVEVNASEAVGAFPRTDSSSHRVHPTKGGICVTDYLTFGSLRDDDSISVAAGEAEFLRQHYHCPLCGDHLICTIVERLEHDRLCHGNSDKMTVAQEIKPAEHVGNQSGIIDSKGETGRDPYWCEACKTEYAFTPIEILKHRMSHD